MSCHRLDLDPTTLKVTRAVDKALARRRSGLTEAGMSVEYAVGILLSVLLLAYLAYALLKPERF